MKRKLLLALFSIMLIGQLLGCADQIPSQASPDLNGTWITDEQEEVEIAHLSNGRVLAVFAGLSSIGPRSGNCDPAKYAVGRRSNYIDGHLEGTTLTGNITLCTPQLLVTRCNLTPTWKTSFTATVSRDKITGTYKGEYYSWSGDTGPCTISDSTGDFTLTRTITPTPFQTETPTSTAPKGASGGICPSGGHKITSDEDKALEQVIGGFQQAADMVVEKLKDTSLIPEEIMRLRALYKAYQRMADYFHRIKASSCISPDLLQWLQARQHAPDDAARGDACTHVCSLTADWLVKIGAVPESAKQYVIETCYLTCADNVYSSP